MTKLEVSSVVRSILEGFTNGMNVFTRLKDRKKKKKQSKPARMSEDELRLHDSLSNRPKQIEGEYARSVVRHGKHFERGDEKAYSSLAHTLLVLNTGLINLINRTLSSEMVDRSKSRQSLLLLTESAAINTMQALTELNARLSMSSSIGYLPSSKRPEDRVDKQNSNEALPSRPAPSPLLSRGGWVRSRSGSSVVSAASAKKWAASNSEHKKSSSKSSTCAAVNTAEGYAVASDQSKDHQCSCQTTPATFEKHLATPSVRDEAITEDIRPPSMLLLPASYFDNQNQTLANSTFPPVPPKIPIHVRSNAERRPRPPSAATFLTASTRIGEIPIHKWPEEMLKEEIAKDLPLPYVIPPPLQPPQRKGRGFKLWKRQRSDELVIAE